MTWQDQPIDNDDEGNPMFKGVQRLLNDKEETLASICGFYDEGPFYAHAMDANNPELIRRIGPCSTLESAKSACEKAIEGRMDISDRAGYLR